MAKGAYTPRYYSVTQATVELFHRTASVHSVRRWIAKGIGSPRVKLNATRIGKYYFVTEDDVRAFKEAVADPSLFYRTQSTERNEKAKRRLVKAGA